MRECLSSPRNDDLTVGELRKEAARVAEEQRELRRRGVVRRQLTRPDPADPEEFYRLVATAYGEYAAESNAPAKGIAEEAGVPVTTVHRWIREARRRGFLPPARKGRAG
jgi:transposase-like protein